MRNIQDDAQYFKNLGEYITTRRQKKGLTQEELADKTGVSRSCIIDIEKGRAGVKGSTLGLILDGLGKTSEDLIFEMTSNARVRFDNEFYEIWDSLSEDNHEDFSLKVNKLSEQLYYDKTKSYYKQVILLLESVVLRRNSDYQESLDKAYEALKISSTLDILEEDGKREKSISMIEYKILIAIANTKSKLGFVKECIEILELCKNELCLEGVSLSVKNRLLPIVYFNLTSYFKDIKAYNKAIDLANEAVEWCKEADNYKKLGEITYNLGTAQLHLGYRDRGIENVKKAYHIFISLEKFDKAAMMVKFVVDSFGAEMYRYFPEKRDVSF